MKTKKVTRWVGDQIRRESAYQDLGRTKLFNIFLKAHVKATRSLHNAMQVS